MTNWLQTYRDKIVTAEQAIVAIQSGQRIFLTGNCSVPQKLVEALVQRAPLLQNVEICQVLTIGDKDYVAPELQDHLCAPPSAKAAPISRPVSSPRFRGCLLPGACR